MPRRHAGPAASTVATLAGLEGTPTTLAVGVLREIVLPVVAKYAVVLPKRSQGRKNVQMGPPEPGQRWRAAASPGEM